jgi:hypothetical protein
MPFNGIVNGKFRLSVDNPQKVKLCARISPRIREKILNCFSVIRGLLGVDSSKKNKTKKPHTTVPLIYCILCEIFSLLRWTVITAMTAVYHILVRVNWVKKPAAPCLVLQLGPHRSTSYSRLLQTSTHWNGVKRCAIQCFFIQARKCWCEIFTG